MRIIELIELLDDYHPPGQNQGPYIYTQTDSPGNPEHMQLSRTPEIRSNALSSPVIHDNRCLRHIRRACFRPRQLYLQHWVPSEAQIDDCLCYFEGSPLPFVIQSREGGHGLVGDCYIHGLMHEPPKWLDMSAMELITLI
jgi:hypothetical protein